MMYEILDKCTVTGNIIKLPEGLSDKKVHDEVSKMIGEIGGKWKGGKTKGFVFDSDPSALLDNLKGAKEKPDVSVAENIKAEFRLVPIDDIFPDLNQPRKFFDEVALAELTESVKKNGVLQPIMVRTTGKTRINFKRKTVAPTVHNSFKDYESIQESGGPLYDLVCGERRYRAALSAGLTEIPAMIRTLTDREAMEIQIIENLQRKDVNPMEEAVAFKRLSEQSFDIAEIALRIGKSGVYVAQRIKLTDLIEEFQEMLFLSKVSMSQAVKLCRITAADQQAIFKESTQYNKDWKTNKHFEMRNVDSYVERAQLDLSKAPFKTNDPLLYPEMGPCNKCPYNTANNPLLFPELNKGRFCTYSICYHIKCDRNYQASIQKAMEDPDILFVNTDSYPTKEDKQKVKAAEEIGAIILNPDLFEIRKKPIHPGTWEEYEKEHDDWSNDSELDDLAREEERNECRNSYNQELQEYEQNLKAFEEAKTNGLLRKAFVVVGNYKAKEGEIVDIMIKPKKGAVLDISGSGSEVAVKIQSKIEISSIKEREARNLELDREKVYKRSTMELLEPFTTCESPTLLGEEWKALAILLIDTSYKASNYAGKKYELSSDYDRFKFYKKFRHDDAIICRLIRIALYDRLVNQVSTDYQKSGMAAIMLDLAKAYIPDQVKEYQTEQKEKAEKRKENVEKRLSALQTKNGELAA